MVVFNNNGIEKKNSDAIGRTNESSTKYPEKVQKDLASLVSSLICIKHHINNGITLEMLRECAASNDICNFKNGREFPDKRTINDCIDFFVNTIKTSASKDTIDNTERAENILLTRKSGYDESTGDITVNAIINVTPLIAKR